MAAVVLAFEAHRLQPRPWQNHELAELYRAVDILGQAGLPVVTDMGVSDEGDPWFAFCRADTGDVIVHCARINNMFVASSIAIGQTFRGADFREVIDSIVRYQPLGLPVANTGSRLYLHPVMVLAAFVATALLCSKKADAHDLHSAVVSLTPDHAAPASHKGGFQALAALLAPSAHVSGALKTHDAVAEFEPVSLATMMATAMIIIGPALEAAAIPVLVESVDSVASPATIVPAFRSADAVAIAAAGHDKGDLLADGAAASAIQVLSLKADNLLDLAPAVSVIFQADHIAATPAAETAPVAVLSAEATAVPAAIVSEHLVAYRPQERVVTTAVAADQPAGATPVADAPHQIDFTTLTPVAISILLGAPDAQPQGDALTLIEQTHSHATPAVPPPSEGTTVSSPPGTGTIDDSFSVSTVSLRGVALSANGAVAVVSSTTTAASVVPVTIAPEHIVMGADPTAGLMALGTYAVTSHPLDGVAVASQDLSFAINVYTGKIGQAAQVVVFDSASIKLPFFEFAKGVLFVDDHQLGIDPSAADLAGAVTVELASGGTMKLLGVVDTAHVALTL